MVYCPHDLPSELQGDQVLQRFEGGKYEAGGNREIQ